MKKLALVLALAAVLTGCDAVAMNHEKTVVVTPERDAPFASYEPVTVKLPPPGKYKGDVGEEALYEKGYALGYMDALRRRSRLRNSVGDLGHVSWIDGWDDGYAAAVASRGK